VGTRRALLSAHLLVKLSSAFAARAVAASAPSSTRTVQVVDRLSANDLGNLAIVVVGGRSLRARIA
jgi:hypothetical protein